MPSEPPSPTESRAILHRLALSSTLLPPATHSSPFPFAHFDPFCWAAMQLRPSSPLLQPAHQDNYVVSTEVVTGTAGEMACGEKLERQAERVSPPRAMRRTKGIWPSKLSYTALRFVAFRRPLGSRIAFQLRGIEMEGEGSRKSCPLFLSAPRARAPCFLPG
jgi:hypothetical protein